MTSWLRASAPPSASGTPELESRKVYLDADSAEEPAPARFGVQDWQEVASDCSGDHPGKALDTLQRSYLGRAISLSLFQLCVLDDQRLIPQSLYCSVTSTEFPTAHSLVSDVWTSRFRLVDGATGHTSTTSSRPPITRRSGWVTLLRSSICTLA